MKFKYILFISLFSTMTLFAQKAKLESADNKYESLAYIDAIDVYEKVAKKGFESAELFKKLGNSYYFNAQLKEAGKWYEKLFTFNQEIEPEYYYRYAQCLKASEDYTKANEYLGKFSQKTSSEDNRSKLYRENMNYLSDIKKISNRYIIENAGINSEFSDYGAAIYKDQLVFASARDTGSVSNIRSKWTNQSFTNLYASKINTNGTLDAPEKFSKKINSKFHESTPVFTNDGKTMYFTRNNFNNGKKGTDNDKTILLKLYKATFDGVNWKDVQELPFNSNNYSVAHPALSPDNKTLYFASNMPGTIGQSDIFKVAINEDGTYGKPENLGLKINTEARETFPFVSGENVLYFASDGQLGLGGLDVFAVKFFEDGSISKVLNLGSPVNSPNDDFAFLIDYQSKLGFFSSNRLGTVGFDDIYKLKEIKPLEFDCKQQIAGFVTDNETNEVVKNANISLLDKDMKIIAEKIVDEEGKYQFKDLECDKIFFIRATSSVYETQEMTFKTDITTGVTNGDLQLDKRVKQIGVGTDLAKTFGIKIIYFDLDKSNIRKDASVELAKIVEVMKQNPSIKIDIRSHTDSRQSSEYNNELSERRAQATKKWMIKNGIAAQRLTAKGYGESKLINKCSDGVECSEEEHQANRRSEFVVIAM
ncbi:Flagellar motor protein MotB [Flavobacterium sp. 9AF]|uniref:OmpA family protein n=1 Tax=Flavobacterium sp. 9AF TaxID=2653142 RepID=UPI0012EEE1DD|nr:OmpA family protein [Flavobacterium sp. 9AF]VXC33192.1 Flagellar motor protein MotB [Flavobacterium sp. 9AF]